MNDSDAADIPAEAEVELRLKTLTQLPTTSGWDTDERIKTTVRRRRARRTVACGAAVLVATGAVTISVGTEHHRAPLADSSVVIKPGQHVGSRTAGAIQLVGNVTALPSDPATLDAVAAEGQRLTVALLQKLGTAGDSNLSVSPSSLQFALGMLANGAAGQTLTEIETALQAGGLSLSAQNSGLAQLTSSLAAAAAKNGITLQSANSLWQQQGFTLQQQFLSEIATYFHAGVWQTDFAGHNAQALAAIDKWTSDHTHGKITKLFDSLDSDTVLVLANALYFHAAWQVPFDASQSEFAPFTTASGKPATAAFMWGSAPTSAVTSTFQGAALPYAGGQFEAVALMPVGQSLSSYVDTLTPAALQSAVSQIHVGKRLPVELPRITTATATDLVPTLQDLGMHLAFGSSADFSKLSNAPTTVDQVVQRVYLGVGENGTTAAAATGVSSYMLSLRATPSDAIRFDHPFLFLIRDKHSGTILFASEINDPTAG